MCSSVCVFICHRENLKKKMFFKFLFFSNHLLAFSMTIDDALL